MSDLKQVNRLKQKHLCCPPPIFKATDITNNETLQFKFPCRIKLATKINSSVGSSNHTQCYTVANQTLNAYGKWAGCPGGSGPGYSSTMRYVPNENVPGIGPTVGGAICNCNYMYGPPYNLEQPVISGNTFVNSILTVSSNGLWTSFTTISYSYQWYRGSTPIPGQTSNNYTIQTADIGQRITCIVKGTNISGSIDAPSNSIIATPPPPLSPPVNTVAPVISGNTVVGSTLTTTNGTWTGFPVPTFGYQWYRGATLISLQTSATYQTQPADLGQNITCRVTGTNTGGSAFATSNIIIPTNGAPVNIAPPEISGATLVGSTLTTTTGTWTGFPVPTFGYQWYRGATLIPGQTSSTTYQTQVADIGQNITCRITGTNTVGSTIVETINAITVSGSLNSLSITGPSSLNIGIIYVDSSNNIIVSPLPNGFTIYRFTSSTNNLNISGTYSSTKSLPVTYLVVGGGGGSGCAVIADGSTTGGGGGGGGLSYGTGTIPSGINLQIQVGGGGLGAAPPSIRSSNGGDSSLQIQNGAFLSVVSVFGGGGGGGLNTIPTNQVGTAGGSGGGGAGQGNSTSQSFGVGGIALIVEQGFNGGSGSNSGIGTGGTGVGGGGGGAGQIGNGRGQGQGGNGAFYNITGALVAYAGGGGGGGTSNTGGNPGTGGLGGGGDGGENGNPGVSGTNGLGGGAGGNGISRIGNGSSGGSGVIILRFPSYS